VNLLEKKERKGGIRVCGLLLGEVNNEKCFFRWNSMAVVRGWKIG
jgi:hypothetical protein